ncbi:MAG: hypothetical protein WCN92_04730 [Eubacteriales bacterium]
MPLPIYIFWWIVRILLIFAAIDMIRKNVGSKEVLQMCVNVFICFMFTLFKLFPKEKFIFSRLSFRFETIVIILNLVTTYIGSYLNWYFTVPSWDMIIHLLGAIAGVYAGYEVTVAANKNRKELAPIVGAICGVGFCSWGAIFWEIFEFTLDQLTGSNIQHWQYIDKNFEIFTLTNPARYALFDTMSDLILGFVGSIVGGIIVFIWLAKRDRKAAATGQQAEVDALLSKKSS